MKYIGLLAKGMIVCCLLIGIFSVAAARQEQVTSLGAVDPLNAVIAAVVAALVGITIYIKRRIQK